MALFFTSLMGCHTKSGEGLFLSHPTDTAITTTLLENMLNDEGLSTVKVRVETTNGIVTLTGYVKTIRQSDSAEEMARKTVGVTSVKNDIVVRK
jgi:osmotically-inducible protein OsmY